MLREIAEELQRKAAPDTRQRGMTPIRVTLPAGVAKRFGIAGDYFHVFSSAMSDLEASFDGDAPAPVAAGVGFRRYYSEVELRSATGGAVVVYAGFGSVSDGRASANVNVTANVEPGNTFDDGGDVDVPDSAVTQIRAANADTLYVAVTNPSDSPGPVRVGTNAVAINSGQLIEPGVTAPIPCTAALYAYHENGSDVTLSVAAVKQV